MKKILCLILILWASVAWGGAGIIGVSSGNVTGPASSTDGNAAVFNGTGGKTLKDGAYKIVKVADCSSYTAIGQICINSSTGVRCEGDGSSCVIQPSMKDLVEFNPTPNTGDPICWDASDASPVQRKCTAAELAAALNNGTGRIDAHAASTTITLVANVCPQIHNYNQAASDVSNTLDAIGESKCFMAKINTAQAANYWRLARAGADTISYWNGTTLVTSKTWIEQATPTVGGTLSCLAQQSGASSYVWYCWSNGPGTWTTD